MVSVVWAFGKVFGGGSGRVRQSPELVVCDDKCMKVRQFFDGDGESARARVAYMCAHHVRAHEFGRPWRKDQRTSVVFVCDGKT